VSHVPRNHGMDRYGCYFDRRHLRACHQEIPHHQHGTDKQEKESGAGRKLWT
jgi:hypothetical protein